MAVEKTIVINFGESDNGKTSSIVKVYEKLSAHYPHVLLTDPAWDDINATVTINNVLVGIISHGDNGSNYEVVLDEMVRIGCTIILTAQSRYAKEVENAIKKYAPSQYKIWWTENARLYKQAEDGSYIAPKYVNNRFNEQWAEEMANLIENWCYA